MNPTPHAIYVSFYIGTEHFVSCSCRLMLFFLVQNIQLLKDHFYIIVEQDARLFSVIIAFLEQGFALSVLIGAHLLSGIHL